MLPQPFGDVGPFRPPGTPPATAGAQLLGTPPARNHRNSQGGSAFGGRLSGGVLPEPAIAAGSGRLSGRSSGVSSRGSKELVSLPLELARQDPLFGATIRKFFGQQEQACFGQVISVDADAQTGQRAYHVSYEDGDEEHMWELEVRSCLVRYGPPGAAQAAAAAAAAGSAFGTVPPAQGFGPRQVSGGALSGGPTPRPSVASGIHPEVTQGFSSGDPWDAGWGFREGGGPGLGLWNLGPYGLFAASMIVIYAMSLGLPWCWSCTVSSLSRDPSPQLSALAEPRPFFGQRASTAEVPPRFTAPELPEVSGRHTSPATEAAAGAAPRFTVPTPPWSEKAAGEAVIAEPPTPPVKADTVETADAKAWQRDAPLATDGRKQHTSPFPPWAHDAGSANAPSSTAPPGPARKNDSPASLPSDREDVQSSPESSEKAGDRSINETRASSKHPEIVEGKARQKPSRGSLIEALERKAGVIAAVIRAGAAYVVKVVRAAAGHVCTGALKVAEGIQAVLVPAWSHISRWGHWASSNVVDFDFDSPDDIASAILWFLGALILTLGLLRISPCRHTRVQRVDENVVAPPSPVVQAASPASPPGGAPQSSPLAVAPPPSPMVGAATPARLVAAPSPMASPAPVLSAMVPSPRAPSPLAPSPQASAQAPSPQASHQMPLPQASASMPLSQRMSERCCQLPSPLAPSAPPASASPLSPPAAALLGVGLLQEQARVPAPSPPHGPAQRRSLDRDADEENFAPAPVTPMGGTVQNRLLKKGARFRHPKTLNKLKEMGFEDVPHTREVVTRNGGNLQGSIRDLCPALWETTRA